MWNKKRGYFYTKGRKRHPKYRSYPHNDRNFYRYKNVSAKVNCWYHPSSWALLWGKFKAKRGKYKGKLEYDDISGKTEVIIRK